MNKKIHSKFINQSDAVDLIIDNFDDSGTFLGEAIRNSIKIFEFENMKLNVKSFKNPKFLNKMIYGYFRKSKARRSYEFANILINKGFKTPQPVAYYENNDLVGLKDCYYVSEQLQTKLTFRDLITTPELVNHTSILRQFVSFSYQLHQKGIEFIDNTPGNTLIKDNQNGTYDFYLVDLNRMNFHEKMSLEVRIANLSRLTTKPEIVDAISKEYAAIGEYNLDEVTALMQKYTQYYKNRYHRKEKIKHKLKFFKK